MIQFGFLSYLLLFGMVQGLVITCGLAVTLINRRANRWLAILTLILTLKLVPYIIGFAGFYAAYPWLDLLPVNWSLGLGPTLFAYIFTLTKHRSPERPWLHMLPMMVQGAFYMVMFVQPLTTKQHFENTIGPAVNRTETLFTALSIAIYLVLTWKRLEEFAKDFPTSSVVRTLRKFLVPVSIALGVFAGAKLVDSFVQDMSYTQIFPVYVLINLVIYALGFVVFRQAAIVVPVMGLSTAVPSGPNWATVAKELTLAMMTSELWKDPEMSIGVAAVRLQVAETRLSRALNQGAGVSFSEWINRRRIEEATRRLRESETEQSILDLAFECGFNSKASFNRWFRAVEGITPSEYRQRLGRS